MSAMSRTAVAVLFLALLFMTACGGGGDSTVVPPLFSLSTPGAASEGTPFTYTLQATAPQGQTVSFAIVSGPAGATLSVATISWTPTHAQSRQPNNFTVRATSSSGGTATTSFTITPAGTVRGTQVITYWSNGIAQQNPDDLSGTPPQILVPDGSGNYVTYTGQGAADGSFSIANVPAGYYWLRLGTMYWTNSSDIDLGRDVPGRLPSTGGLFSPVPGNFNISGMEPWISGIVSFPGSPAPEYYSGLGGYSPEAAASVQIFPDNSIPDSSTSFVGQLQVFPLEPLNASAGDATYVLQTHTSYPPGNWGVTRVVKALGPLQLTYDATTTSLDVNGQFGEPSPSSARINVKAAGFVNSITGTNPNANYGFDGFAAGVSAAPGAKQYATYPNLVPGMLGRTPELPMAYLWSGSTFSTGSTITDFDAGDVSFVNPFPSLTTPVYFASQSAATLIYQSGNASAYLVGNSGFTTTTAPTAAKPFDLPMGNVQNPQLNGANLFQATSMHQPITVSWQPPTGLAPTAYEVNLLKFDIPAVCSGPCVQIASASRFTTSATSLTVPPGIVQDGGQYMFTIRAISDSATNVSTAPNRGSWNRAYSEVISNLITAGTAPAPASRAVEHTDTTNTSKRMFVIRDSNGSFRSFTCSGEAGTNCTQ